MTFDKTSQGRSSQTFLQVSLKIYDVLGKEVATLVNEVKEAGKHEVTFEASHLPSGMYLYRLQSGNTVLTHKMILNK